MQIGRYHVMQHDTKFIVTDIPSLVPGEAGYWKTHPTFEAACEDARALAHAEEVLDE